MERSVFGGRSSGLDCGLKDKSKELFEGCVEGPGAGLLDRDITLLFW